MMGWSIGYDDNWKCNVFAGCALTRSGLGNRHKVRQHHFRRSLGNGSREEPPI